MEKLPDEVVAIISEYLSVKDVVLCCAVSPQWRDAFGSDAVWRTRCDVDSEEYLRTSPCRVEPKFISPQAEDSTLSPIGQWRMAYMRELHLRRNWIQGNCLEDKINIDSVTDVAFLNNNIVIMKFRDSVELRDTSVNPSVVVAKLRNVIPGNYPIRVVRSDTFITISDWGKTVQVVGVDLESRTLSVKHTISVSGGERIIYYIVVDNMFLGLGTNCIQVWDLDSGTKLKIESCLLVNGHFKSISLERQNNCKDAVVIAKDENEDYHCFIYNVKGLKFLPFTQHFPQRPLQRGGRTGYKLRSAVVKEYVALTFGSVTRIYNYNTSQLLQTFKISGIFTSVRVLGDCFMFINDYKYLVSFCPMTRISRCLHSDPDGFMCHGKKLVTIYRRRWGIKRSLWMVGPETVDECRVDSRFLMHVNKSHSTILKCNHQDGITQVHFW